MKNLFSLFAILIMLVCTLCACSNVPEEWQGGNGDESTPPVTNAQGMVKITIILKN